MKDGRWGWWSLHNRFSLPLLFPHTFFPLQHQSSTIAAALQDEPALQSMGSPWAAEISCSELGASFLDPGTPTLVPHLILLPPPISLLCYLPFPECFLNSTTDFPDGLSSGTLILLQRWLEVAVTGTGQLLDSPCSPPTTKTLPHKTNTSLNDPHPPLSGDMRFWCYPTLPTAASQQLCKGPSLPHKALPKSREESKESLRKAKKIKSLFLEKAASINRYKPNSA